MNKSEQLNELAKALAAAQGEMHNPAFDAKNPHFKSAYASLASVRNTVLPVLSKHGLSVVQMPCNVGELPAVTTVLMHSSGQYVEETFSLPADRQNAHGYGSALTYLRRYSLQAVAGVVGDEDDDGNAAVASVNESEGKKAAKAIAANKVTPTAGAMDELTKEEQETLHALSRQVIEKLAEGNDWGAYEMLEHAKLNNDQKIAIWTLFNSKQRATLKQMRENELASAP